MSNISQHSPITLDLATEDDDSVFQNQTLAGAGNFTLNGVDVSGGVWTSPDGLPHQLIVTAAADESARTLTVTGFYDENQKHAASFTIAAPNATTTETSVYVYSISNIAYDGATTGNVKVGFVDEAIKVIPVSAHADITRINVVPTGTVQFDIEQTITPIFERDPQHPHAATHAYTSWSWAPLESNKTAAVTSVQDGGFNAIRIKTDSYSAGAELLVEVLQKES